MSFQKKAFQFVTGSAASNFVSRPWSLKDFNTVSLQAVITGTVHGTGSYEVSNELPYRDLDDNSLGTGSISSWAPLAASPAVASSSFLITSGLPQQTLTVLTHAPYLYIRFKWVTTSAVSTGQLCILGMGKE